MARRLVRTTGWRTVLALFFVTSFVESMSMSHVFAFLPVYLQAMQVPDVETWVGVLSAITFVTGLPLVPLWGIWADRYGGKPIIIRSAYVEMAVLLLLGVSRSLPGVVAAMALVGFQLGNTGIMLSSLRRVAPDGRVGFAVSVFSVASSLGMAGGPLIGGLITGLHWLNLHGLYEMDGVLSCLTGTLLLTLYHPTGPSAAGVPGQPPVSAWTAAWRSLRFTFTLPVTWTLFGIYTLLMMARQMVTPYLPIAIERLPWHFGTSTVSIGMLMGLSAVVGAVITVLAGHAGDRTGYIRVLSLAFGVLVPAVVTLAWARHLALFTAALTVFSAGNSIGGAMLFALFSTRIPDTHRNTALNLIYLPLYLGGIAGPAASAGLAQAGWQAPFLGAAVLFAAGIATTVLTRRILSTAVPAEGAGASASV
ncbi:MAG: MFS transporter [Alicyclobacillaceae bacterium]|nr:MFS transporter [Alicyclobacillaceae bacterium]